MGNPVGRGMVFWGLMLTVVLSGGCSVSSFGSGRSSESTRLMDTAKALRKSTCVPPDLPRELDKHPLPPYFVEPGDVLLVQPADLDSPVRLPADQPVLPDGTIHLGRYGCLPVTGLTIEQIEAALRALIEAQTKNAGPITVRVVARISKVYYVLGDVNAPGAYPLHGRETVLDGIIAAGGLTDRASRRNIILTRPTRPDSCRFVLPVCYREIVQLGDTTTNYQLAPGDRIYVPNRSFWEDCFHSKDECPSCKGHPNSVPAAVDH